MAEKQKYDYTKRIAGEKVAIVANINYISYIVIGTLAEFSDSIVRLKTPTTEVKVERKDLKWILPDECFDVKGNLTRIGQIIAAQHPTVSGERFNEILRLEQRRVEVSLKANRAIPKMYRIMAVV